ISQVNSELWYSATVLESEQPFGVSKDRVTNYIQADRKYLPLSLGRADEGFRNNSSWLFKERIPNKNDWKPSTLNINPATKYVETKIKRIRKNCSVVPRKEHARTNKNRTRFLDVFEVVEIEHVSCTSSSGLEGVCLHEMECRTSGTAMGSCADGYGTCCVRLLECESQSSAAMGWFTNPDFPYPSTARLSCAVTLNKYSEDVTQIRLDFTSFEFVVSGQNINNVVPILCGINTGQHVYVEVGNAEGPVYLTIQTDTAENRLFSIKVSQLTSSDALAAPAGCLQYFTEPSWYLESFNYLDKSEIGITRVSSYLNNLNYAMCIERAPGTCSVTYSAGYMQIVNYDSGNKHYVTMPCA
ncbi:Uncharacterized protein OBRU01_23787, partial [Operophtera brumata]